MVIKIMSKIIFLDIDGVLNVIPQGEDKYGPLFHSHFVSNLEVLINITSSKIVITSSWRKSGLPHMKRMWEFRNYPGEIIDVIPSLFIGKQNIDFYNDRMFKHPTPKVPGYIIPRGCEIEYWLIKLSQEVLDEPITHYVILDDDNDMLLNQQEHYVNCSSSTDSDCVDIGYGLTKKVMYDAIFILNK